MTDAWELSFFGDLTRDGTGDFDSDGMNDLAEFQFQLDPTVDDAYRDADGDRYPNVFEVRKGSNAADSSSLPTPDFVVDAANGGNSTTDNIYSTVAQAITASGTDPTAYAIIGVEAGTYTGSGNSNFRILANQPNLLIIGLHGAARTTLDGGGTLRGPFIYRRAAVASLSIRRTLNYAIYLSSASGTLLADLSVVDNGDTYYGAIYAAYSSGVRIVGSTFFRNTSGNYATGLYANSSQISFESSLLWDDGALPETYVIGTSAVTANYSLVRNDELSGTGNLTSVSDPGLRSDGRQTWSSLLRDAGALGQSSLDMDLEVRSSTTTDIGVDEWVDVDGDELADQWEIEMTGGLTTLTGRSQDSDGDGATNEAEYAGLSDPTNADTDGDGLNDGGEFAAGTDPLSADTDGDTMLDGQEVAYGLDPLNDDSYHDADGDRYPNAFELAKSSDPSVAASVPTPDVLVDPVTGGSSSTDNIYATIAEAIAATGTDTSAYVIVGIRPGTYSVPDNGVGLRIDSFRPHLLVIGLQGAARTIIDAGRVRNQGYYHDGISLRRRAAVVSLTLRNTDRYPVYLSSASGSVLADIIATDNHSWYGTVYAYLTDLRIVGSTFYRNQSNWSSTGLYVGISNVTIESSVFWNDGTLPETTVIGASTLTANNSLVRNDEASGTGNLVGIASPGLRADGRQLWVSPLRDVGAVNQSAVDIDLEARPALSSDIGADEWTDVDGDELADAWEIAAAESLSVLTSRSQDSDGDGLTNGDEYAALTDPTVSDTDGDGLGDAGELAAGTDPLVMDTDGDGMMDGPEVSFGLDPLAEDAHEDADGDRYPNIFEVNKGSSPADSASVPAADFFVDAANGGASATDNVYATLQEAVVASGTDDGRQYIIGVRAGTYLPPLYGGTHLRIDWNRPHLLIIGLQGAAQTIIDGAYMRSLRYNYSGIDIRRRAAVVSLTVRGMNEYPISVSSASGTLLADLLICDNHGTYAPLYINNSSDVRVVGCTLYNNRSTLFSSGVYANYSEVAFESSALWNESALPEVHIANPSTLVANNSMSRNDEITGTANLTAVTDPGFDRRGRLLPNSPLRGQGAAVRTSRLDMHLESRTSGAVDIGVDQWTDADSDGMADVWEVEWFSDLTTATSTTDADNDGLVDAQEHVYQTDPTDADSDDDSLSDGIEVTLGSDPLVSDVDDQRSDTNADGIIDGIASQLGYSPFDDDFDGDGLTNREELLQGLDPLSSDTDGDGVADGVDAFPHDPLLSSLSSGASAPQIILHLPARAVPQ